jgi:hypothetical protein
MRLKTLLPMILISVLGVVMASFFTGSMLLGQTLKPFQSLNTTTDTRGILDKETIIDRNAPSFVSDVEGGEFNFVSGDLFEQWIPWIIQQVSILVGGLSLIVFVYAGVMLIIGGDNEEQLKTSSKMIVFGLIGIALAGFSYTIVANVLSLL